MAKRLQKFGNRERDYDRPNRNWICGHSDDGRECPLGPGARGKCRGTGECLPLRKGDRWFCTRPESRGGECPPGPGPKGQCGSPLTSCQPVRSLRVLRRRAVQATVLVTAGFLIAVLAGKPRDAAINAGRLTSAHAGENLDCRSCHIDTPLSKLTAVFDPHFLNERAMTNSERCLACHGEAIGDWIESARFAHGWTEKEIRSHTAGAAAKTDETPAITDTQLAVLFASKETIRSEGAEGNLACATCHQEHHGAEFSLTQLSNQQCQVCHQSSFHSFADGHPAFAETGYPYTRRTRIFFDHESHYRKHFAEDSDSPIPGYSSENPFQEGTSCRHCHQPDEKGEFMRLRGYEVSCAKCHENSVKGGDPITLLAVPAIDREVAGGRWPASGYGLIAPMRLLLGEAESEAVAGLKADDDFGVVALEADPSRREVAKLVASDLRALALDAWREGNGALATRMEAGGFLDQDNSAGLFEGLSIDTVRAFLFPGIRWDLGELAFPRLDLATLNRKLGSSRQRSVGFWPAGAASPLTPLMLHLLSHRPELDEDLEILRSFADDNGEIRLGDLSGADERAILAVERISWEIRELFASLRRSGAPFLEQFETLRGGVLDLHETESILDRVFLTAGSDENFMREFGSELERFRQGQYPPAVKISRGETPGSPASSPSKGKDDDFGADDDFEDAEKSDTPAADDDDDFGEDDAFGKKADEMPEKEAAAVADDEFGDAPAGDDEKAAGETKSDGFKVFEPSPVDWQTTGGWFHENHAVHYASRGHADPVLKSWIESSVSSLNSADARQRFDGRRVLTHVLGYQDGVKSNASGKCFKCHSVDRESEGGAYRVNWFGAFAHPAQRNRSSELTRFSHGKHFIALDCTRCHSLKDSGTYADFFPGRGAPGEKTEPGRFSSNFHPVNKKTSCANCHQASKAGESCLQCHRYHSLKK